MIPDFIPIGTERESIRRTPAVTLGIIGVCTAVFLLTRLMALQTPAERRRLQEAVDEAVRYWAERPYLVPPDDMVFYVEQPGEERPPLPQGDRPAAPAGLDGEQLIEQQMELERLWSRVRAALPENPVEVWGFSTQQVSAVTLVTHMFLHGSWLHLLGNMLFLFVVGTLLEDVWGRLAFGGFYLLAGLVSSLVDPLLVHYDDDVVSIGASGAVSGAMGAFAVRFWNVRLRIVAMFQVLWKTFSMRAWVVLACWFTEELLYVPEQLEGKSRVAHVAHIAGFTFGAAFALLLRCLRAEERWLDRGIRAKTEREIVRDEDLDRALALVRTGSHERAWPLLVGLVERSPANVDAALALWSVATELGRAREAAPAGLRAVAEELRRGQRDLAVDHWREMRRCVPGLVLDPVSQVSLAETLARRHARDEAAEALRELLDSEASAPNPATLLRAAALAEQLDPSLARAAACRALGRSDLDPGERAEAERILARGARIQVPVAGSG